LFKPLFALFILNCSSQLFYPAQYLTQKAGGNVRDFAENIGVLTLFKTADKKGEAIIKCLSLTFGKGHL